MSKDSELVSALLNIAADLDHDGDKPRGDVLRAIADGAKALEARVAALEAAVFPEPHKSLGRLAQQQVGGHET